MKESVDPVRLHEILTEKGVENFYHANTSKTALSFIAANALLSRNYVESNGLTQTEQYTDTTDKKLGIWDCVFLDGCDLHKKFSRPNNYGPVLFYMSLDILLEETFKSVRITKFNPASWSNTENKFYTELLEFEKVYLTGNKFIDGGIMFIFEEPDVKIALNKYCRKIVLDNPFITVKQQGEERLVPDLMRKTYEDALAANNLSHIPIEFRHGKFHLCNCRHLYPRMYTHQAEKFKRFFSKA